MAQPEVIIVGGGPSGTAAALALARRRPEIAERVVILEKDRYPRDKVCAGAVAGRADRLLQRLGVSADVPSVTVRGVSAAVQGGELCARAGVIGRVVRRIELDRALAQAARRRGVQVIEGARVTGVSLGPDGAFVESSEGSFEARAVIGADGVGSVVRRALGLPFGRLRAQVVELDTEPTAADRPRDLLHFDLRDRSYPGYAWDFPTIVGGEPLVCRGVYVLHPAAVSPHPGLRADKPRSAPDPSGPTADPEQILRARLAAMGLEPDRYRVKRFAERGLDAGGPLAAPRALLIGEAAGIDPLLGEGIAQAIAYGALAGDYLAERLPAGDLRFADWDRRVRRSVLGADLHVRRRLLRRIYGGSDRDRDLIERFTAAEPSLLRFGVDYFSGDWIDPRDALRTAIATALLYTQLRRSTR